MINVQTSYPERPGSLVKSFWHLEVATEGPSRYQEEIIPDGHHEIIFHINREAGRIKLIDTDWFQEPRAFLAGQTSYKHLLELLPGSRLYGIRFYPHTISAFFPLPVHELTDQILGLDQITDERPFWDCIADDPGTTFRNFERLLEKLYREKTVSLPGYAYVDAAVNCILRNKGSVSGQALLQKTGISKKHLETLFLQYVGITPKFFSRIIQLNHFIAYQHQFPEQSLTACSYAAGYYDQAHLIRSFHSFAGVSPGSYFGNLNEINDIFTRL